ncbi:Pescadillo like protein [Nosema bombycis CQ1]|uniref:Pescadillo like protein n=1 Tax=Nosema bombycis (strain CQ1 / CVCC 102059) TaxID=578461 RepID=R0M9F3_NOSB1|nr:Pescadillo like protein [Nosema bombycis CQ1]|eukprot:EOB14614.1 Pescadillo like protein [Nosema bombycis CQ1]
MVQKYLKPVKKFASKKLIMEKLDLKPKDFDLLVSLTGIHPYVPKRKEKYDLTDDFYFKISDYEKIKHSHVIKTIKYNNKRLKKKQDLIDNRLYDKAEDIKPREFKYVDLVKDRYSSLPKALDDLGDSLTSLCLSKRLNLDEEVDQIINDFYSFCINHGLLVHGFMSTKGIYYEINIENIRIIWLNPYPNTTLQEIIKIKIDEPKPFKWSKLNFLHFASDDEDLGEEEFEPVNDPNKLDVSLLSYSLPFQKFHLKLILFKLKKLLVEHEKQRQDFLGMKFRIENENIREDLILVIKSLSGEIVEDDSFDFCIGERIENYTEGKVYLHPQYVFDTLNSQGNISFEDYKIGKKIPKHISPFALTNFVNPDVLSTLSKTKRNRLQDIVDGYKDVHYQ